MYKGNIRASRTTGVNMYELQELIKTFKEHAIQTEKNQEQWKKSWVENNPGEPMPDHIKDDFNFPNALFAICVEIDKLWIAIGGK